MRPSLYKTPSCQTLSNGLDKSRKTTLTCNDRVTSNAL